MPSYIAEMLAEHNANHTAVQVAVAEKVGGTIEKSVPNSGPNGGTGRADIFVKSPDSDSDSVGNIWEVKPDNEYWNEQSNKSENSMGKGRKQNNRYIDASEGDLQGGYAIPSFVIPHPSDDTKEISIRSGDPTKAVVKKSI